MRTAFYYASRLAERRNSSSPTRFATMGVTFFRNFGREKIRIHQNICISPLFPRRCLPRGGDSENNSDRQMTFNWMEVPQCRKKTAIRMSQPSDCLAGDF